MFGVLIRLSIVLKIGKWSINWKSDLTPVSGVGRPVPQEKLTWLTGKSPFLGKSSCLSSIKHCSIATSHGKSPFLIRKPSINGPFIPWLC